MLLFTVAMAISLLSCGKSDGDGSGDAEDTAALSKDHFYVNWGDGKPPVEYKFHSGDDRYTNRYELLMGKDWYKTPPIEKLGYDFLGIYTEKDGGDMIVDSVGNFFGKDFEGGRVYYARLQPQKVRIVFKFSTSDNYAYYKNAIFFEGGLKHISIIRYANDAVDFELPRVIGGADVLRWKKETSDATLADGYDIRAEYVKISDMMAKNGEAAITLVPVLSFENKYCTLTLNDGSSVTEKSLKFGTEIGEHLIFRDIGSSEIAGWVRDKGTTDPSKFVGSSEIILSDTELFAVWKGYDGAKLYGVGSEHFGDNGNIRASKESTQKDPMCELHVFRNEPIYLPTPVREGYLFLGWYDNPEFSGAPVSRIAEYGKILDSYYARLVKSEYEIGVNFTAARQVSSDGMYENVTKNERLRIYLDPESLAEGIIRYKADIASLSINGKDSVNYFGMRYVESITHNTYGTVFDYNGYALNTSLLNEGLSYNYKINFFRKGSFDIRAHYQDPTGAPEGIAVLLPTAFVLPGDGLMRYRIDLSAFVIPEGYAIEGFYSDPDFKVLLFDGKGYQTSPLTYNNGTLVSTYNDIYIKLIQKEG